MCRKVGKAGGGREREEGGGKEGKYAQGIANSWQVSGGGRRKIKKSTGYLIRDRGWQKVVGEEKGKEV